MAIGRSVYFLRAECIFEHETFGVVQYCYQFYQLRSFWQEVDFNLTPVNLINASFNQPKFFTTIQ